MVKKSLPKYLEMFIENLRILETNLKKGSEIRDFYLMGSFQCCITGIQLVIILNNQKNNINNGSHFFLQIK